MFTSFITILFCIASFILLTQPALMLYGGEDKAVLEILEKLGLNSQTRGYSLLKFEDGQNIYLTVASVFMIMTLAFAGLTLFASIVNFFLKDKSKSNGVGAKFVALFYFLSALITAVMFALYAQELGISSENVKLIYTVGWGMLAVVGSSLIALIFAPLSRKRKIKERKTK